ncbi:type 1 glutamine amidotransferase [Pseudorhodoplanes sp.]|uniref:type 1 glutamine amidotransferase n=1 Tax=Pseudorhodoplanes sp. TaxID=1934341 RepID=UPI003D0C62F6
MQHEVIEPLGVFEDFLRADGATWHVVEIDEGEKLPSLEPFDAMFVMGGPQDVWQEDLYPWLRDEKAAIRRFVAEMRRPFFGICLGHQLLADALGGRVQKAKVPEYGLARVWKTDEGARDPLLRDVSNPFTALQWHGAEVVAPPDGAAVLAYNEACAIQSFRYGDRAYGVQFHIEVTKDTVIDWSKHIRPVMDDAELARKVDTAYPELQALARNAYDCLKQLWAQAPA